MKGINILTGIAFLMISCCTAQNRTGPGVNPEGQNGVIVGAERTELYFPGLKGKKIAVVANQTSMIGNVHLVDSLVHAGINDSNEYLVPNTDSGGTKPMELT